MKFFIREGYVFADNDDVGIEAAAYASRILGTAFIYVEQETEIS